MNTEQRQNFIKHIEFIERLPPEKFFFAFIVRHGEQTGCGTIGCFMGWTPATFPERVSWTCDPRMDTFNGIFTDTTPITNVVVPVWMNVAEELFGIPSPLAELLLSHSLLNECSDEMTLIPKQSSIHPSLPDLSESAGNKDVCSMLRMFLSLVDDGKIILGQPLSTEQ